MSGTALSDLIALDGAGAQFIDLDEAKPLSRRRQSGTVRIGIHRGGCLPLREYEDFDILLSTDAAPPRPFVCISPAGIDAAMAGLAAQIERQPVAASVAAQVLRLGGSLSFDHALLLESLAYSMLLASQGFRQWRAATPIRTKTEDAAEPRVLTSRSPSRLDIQLNRPGSRNAFDAEMRDALVDALDYAAGEPVTSHIELTGAGACFSAGGDLDEFGSAGDVGIAHLIRAARSPARLVHTFGARITARLHGACIGAGIEIPAAAARVTALPGTFFRLPEVSMGLIPGAGGTASIPRRIGRHRACYMAISGADIDIQTALAWGLIDEAVP